jgi:hypothetical protein
MIGQTDVEKVIDIFPLFLVKDTEVFVFVGKDIFLDEGTKFNVIVVPISE